MDSYVFAGGNFEMLGLQATVSCKACFSKEGMALLNRDMVNRVWLREQADEKETIFVTIG